MGYVSRHGELAATMAAQERLGFVMDVAAGTGNLKKAAQRQHMRDLRRMARRATGDPFTRSEAVAAPEGATLAPSDFGIEVVYTKEKPGPGWPTVVATDGG